MGKQTLRLFTFYCLLLFSIHPCLGDVLAIVPKGLLPTIVPKYGTVSAYYKVTNTTTTTLTNNTITQFPLNTTQSICQPLYCQSTFDLAPNQSCLIKLTIKGPIDGQDISHQLTICDGIHCSTPTADLNVTEVLSLPFIGLAAGNFFNSQIQSFPLIARTPDNGQTWDYPASIFTDLSSKIPGFQQGALLGAHCSGTYDKNLCTVSGYFCKDTNCLQQFPMVSVSQAQAISWTFPSTIFENPNTAIDPNFQSGYFVANACNSADKDAICLAAGNYQSDATFFPLLAISQDGGKQWHYEKTLKKPHSYFNHVSCTQTSCDSTCAVTGLFCDSAACNHQLSEIAITHDKGNTWTLPTSVFSDLTTRIDSKLQDLQLVHVNCSGQSTSARCMAVGSFFNGHTVPVIAFSNNAGDDWQYPSTIYDSIAERIGHNMVDGYFRAGHCSGFNASTLCLAVGAFTTPGSEFPLLAISKNSGIDWIYPEYIYTKLRSAIDPNLTRASFNAAACVGAGKHGQCFAAGSYCLDKLCTKGAPFIAVGTNGGKIWQYPPSVFQQLTTRIDNDFQTGVFNDIHCSGNENYFFCIASGGYSNSQTSYPLLAWSNDGLNWYYPTEIFTHLTSQIGTEFIFGSFNKAATAAGKLKAMLFNHQSKIS